MPDYRKFMSYIKQVARHHGYQTDLQKATTPAQVKDILSKVAEEDKKRVEGKVAIGDSTPSGDVDQAEVFKRVLGQDVIINAASDYFNIDNNNETLVNQWREQAEGMTDLESLQELKDTIDDYEMQEQYRESALEFINRKINRLLAPVGPSTRMTPAEMEVTEKRLDLQEQFDQLEITPDMSQTEKMQVGRDKAYTSREIALLAEFDRLLDMPEDAPLFTSPGHISNVYGVSKEAANELWRKLEEVR